MTRTATTLSIFFLFLHMTSGESCCTSADGDGTFGDDEPDSLDINCFSQLEFKDSYSSLTCNFTELPPPDTNYSLAVCTKEDSSYICSNMEKHEDEYFSQFTDILSKRYVCMDSEMKRKICKSLILTEIVKPEIPFDINITYQKEANEYLIHYSTPHSWKKYLKDKLIHQIDYRQKEGIWKTIKSQYLQIKLLGKNLEKDASYEVRVRSEPNGDYFRGTWSEWSPSKSFRTSREHSLEKDTDMLMIILCILGLILSIVMIVLVLTFWENRIKPAVWPNLPDHKKTLEQLCKKPKNNFDISFNPESFGYVHIHKVDGIQARAEMESFLQMEAALRANIPEKDRSGSNLKMSPTRINKSHLNLPVTYGGIWPDEALNGSFGKSQFLTTEEFSSSSTYEVCSSNVALCNGGPSLHCSPPLYPSGQTQPDPVSPMQPNSEIRSASNEDEYVTMSSFYKTQ
ncbi:PREDICTED: interleukin-7 receptor subunit alpha [Tinamus guttatus]|nr:PREDICTED: interleukin-7 receptor subunit alpha [Tinamus guttatus]